MARKHAQRPDKSVLVCGHCKRGDCNNCVDVLRAIYTDNMICRCTRQGHGGEAINNQILDPETGSVHGPGAVIKADGTVITDDEWKEEWKRRKWKRRNGLDRD